MTSPSRGAAETSIVSVRLTHTEREQLSTKADACRMALSTFIRTCAMNSDSLESASRPRVKTLSTTERTQIALILASLACLMDTLRDFEDMPSETQDQPIMLGMLRREIITTRDQCFTALGRKP